MRDGLGLLLLLVQLVLLVPLIWHTFKTRSGAGVSLTGEAIWAVAGLGWLLYGALFDSWTITVSGVIAFLGCGVMTLFLWRLKTPKERKNALWLSALTAFGLSVGLLFFGAEGLSVALAIFGVVQFIPQTIYSTKLLVVKGDVSGVSLAGSLLRSLYTLGWAFYAGAWFVWGLSFASIDVPLVAWGLAGFVAFGVQALSIIRNRVPANALLSS